MMLPKDPHSKGMHPILPTSLLVLLLWTFMGGVTVVGETTTHPTAENPGSTNSTTGDHVFHEHEHKDKNGTVTFNVTLDAVTLKEGMFFIEKLFDKYGGGAVKQLSKHSLEALLHHLGLGSDERSKRSLPPKHVHSTHDECLTVNEMLTAFHLTDRQSLTPEEFSYLCPAIVYQLDTHACNNPHSDDPNANCSHTHNEDSHGSADRVHSSDHDSHSDHDHDHDHDHDTNSGVKVDVGKFDLGQIPARVWGFSAVAVLIISLVGLLGVAVIPIMQKVFYNHLLQFLVALAIGALSGDALLHLLPHSIMADAHKHDHDSDIDDEKQHAAAAWKGLMALGGILFFFVMERLLTIITVIKRDRNSNKQKQKKRCKKFCDIESNSKSVGSKLSHRQHHQDECDRTVMLVHPNKALESYADTAHDEFMHQCDEDVHSLHSDKKSPVDPCDPAMELIEVSKKNDVDGFENSLNHSHGHSHGGHGHAHAVPTSVAAVAWMVILGDGIHNFSDGLAIGAAFASSITGGFSTAIAVFCHELPHEIGDFAVLLRAGMPPKQAILYNCLSSLLCFLGMLIGVSIGNISSASLWIFAAVGGMFLYIALVDMLPEMTAVDPKKGENPFLHLLLQIVGILFGSGIMLIIALYEHDIKRALD